VSGKVSNSKRRNTTSTEPINVDMLSVEQVAQRLGTKVRFVRRLVAERRIRFYKVGKYVRFHPDDIADYIRQGQVDPITLSWCGGKAVA
jgi:excisionase family DNA binding protein